jgi:hypothetical protein
MGTKAVLSAALAAFAFCLIPVSRARSKDRDGAASSEYNQPLSAQEKTLHVLNRLTYGPRPGDVEQVEAMGLKKWIALQLHPERIPENPVLETKLSPLDSLTMSPAELLENYPAPRTVKQMVSGKLPMSEDPDQRLLTHKMVERMVKKQDAGDADQDHESLAAILSPQQARAFRTGTAKQRVDVLASLTPEKQDQVLEALGPKARLELYSAARGTMRRRIELASGPRQVVARDLIDAKVYRAVYSNRQLEEVLADFWYNHFNVFLGKGVDHYLVTAYERDAIRPRVLGRFEDLLRATAQSPAMLFYLDNWQSNGTQTPSGRRNEAGVNENYGRELLELHTLGVDGGYTQKDVTEVARCFTGWTIRQPRRNPEFVFNAAMHDDGEKIVLGTRIAAGGGMRDGLTVLRLLAHHPATAQMISRQLAMRFVSDDPPAALVDRMANTFLKQDGDIRAVLETMFDSPEFWSRTAYRAKLKSPLEVVASSMRALNADVDFGFALENQLKQLGEPLYEKQEPTGYSNAGAEWINSSALLARMNFATALANNRIPGVSVEPQSGEGMRLGSPEFQKK